MGRADGTKAEVVVTALSNVLMMLAPPEKTIEVELPTEAKRAMAIVCPTLRSVSRTACEANERRYTVPQPKSAKVRQCLHTESHCHTLAFPA